MPSSSTSKKPAFARLAARFADAEEAERAAAGAYEAGAVGLEERDDELGVTLLLYVPSDAAAALRAALASGDPAPRALGAIEPVPDTDWSEHWKQGLSATVISPRLVVRPSFVVHALAPGQVEVVIDPGQAFGTGTHASTRLALDWVDELAPSLAKDARVLDVGTGSGVLALAAAALAPVRVVAFDLDPLAVREARFNAARAGCADRVHAYVGGLEALGARAFDLVLANLLSSESTPLLAGLAARTRSGGQAVFSGLLAAEVETFSQALAAVGFTLGGVREFEDPTGDRWAALLTRR
jgi:ribosomal protein L11 methyltransferase